MQQKAIHLNVNGKPACGYNRWNCMWITSTKNKKSVTCKRIGCR